MSYAEAREKVRVGMSMAQVEQIMGKPPQSSTFNGENTWAYVSVSLGANARNPFTVRSGVSTKVLSVRFDRSGKVKAVDFQESAG
jgi:outer membrane protein assembly factor BamE (lipoprotein component of BamABCDE complex)